MITALVLIAGAYQLVAIFACLRFLLSRDYPVLEGLPGVAPSTPLANSRGSDTPILSRDREGAVVKTYVSRDPGVSVLKPLYGRDPHMEAALQAQIDQDYPRFEVLCGVHSLDDPAARLVSDLGLQLMECPTHAPNRKVGILQDLARVAKHPVFVVNDSDIRVTPDYLRHVTAPLADDRMGLVTCLYRATADSWPARLEALGVATDFAPSTLVAPLVGVNEFGLGSTMAFRREQLQQIGGFESIADYLADDYQLGKRISRLGLRVHLSKYVVETHLGGETWADVWRHQVRWARTIRVSKGGYFGMPVTNATLWALMAALAGAWTGALTLLALRLTAGAMGGIVLRCGITARYWWLMPLRDLFGFVVWVAGLFGSEVRWRGRRVTIDKQGRILPLL